MIVKVQISLPANGTKPRRGRRPQVLVYSEDRSVEWTGPADAAVLEVMDGEPKAFFHASVNAQQKLVLEDRASWQEW